MRSPQNRIGSVAITAVLGITLTLTLAALLLYTLVSAKIDALHGYKDRFTAYYLCETGISVAMLDFAQGKIGKNSGQWAERDFDYEVNGKKYKIHYKISRPSGAANYKVTSSVYKVTSSVKSPYGLNKTYYLTASGPRAFPIFIRGFAGGK